MCGNLRHQDVTGANFWGASVATRNIGQSKTTLSPFGFATGVTKSQTHSLNQEKCVKVEQF